MQELFTYTEKNSSSLITCSVFAFEHFYKKIQMLTVNFSSYYHVIV